MSYFRNEDQSHGKVTAEDVGEGDKSKGGILLVSYHHGDWGGDDAQYRHVVDGHSHQSAVVNLLHLPSHSNN